MEWVKLAAVPAYYIDGSILRAGEAAEVLFCRGLAHCGNVESAGLIDKTVLPMLVMSKASQRADALVREGLWLDEGTHYRVRSWDKWQDAHDVAAETRRKDRERQREHRKRAREAGGRDKSKSLSRDSHAPLSRDSHSDKRDGHTVDVEGDVERDKNRARAEVKTLRSTALSIRQPDGFSDFWDAYPRKQAKQDALKAWTQALKRGASPSVVIAAACRLRDDPSRDPAYTPYPASWLRKGQYDDELPLRPAGRPVIALSTTDQRVEDGLALVAYYREQEGA